MNSSIIRKPKKIAHKSAERENEKVSKMMLNFSADDDLNIEIKSELKSSRMIISNAISDI
jgi:hypothetical protein